MVILWILETDSKPNSIWNKEINVKKIKKLWWKHWNILPWLVCGMETLIDGEISRFQYGLTWLCVLAMVWKFMPIKYHGDRNDGE